MRPVSDCLAYLHVVRSFAESGCTCSSNRRTPLATLVCSSLGGPLSHEMGDAEPRLDQPEDQMSVRLLTQDEMFRHHPDGRSASSRAVLQTRFRGRPNSPGVRRRFDHIVVASDLNAVFRGLSIGTVEGQSAHRTPWAMNGSLPRRSLRNRCCHRHAKASTTASSSMSAWRARRRGQTSTSPAGPGASCCRCCKPGC